MYFTKTDFSIYIILLATLLSCTAKNIIIGEYKKIVLPPERQELVFHDTTNSLSLAEILSHKYDSEFKNLKPEERVSQKSGTYWLKVQFKKVYSKPVVIYLSNDYNICELYVLKQPNILALRPINSLNWNYLLPSEYQSLPIIIKIKSPNYYSGVGFAMLLYSEYANAVANDMFYYGLILGIIFLTLVYTFVMFLGIKERFYLYYFFYVLSFGIYLFLSKINIHSLFNLDFPHELYFYSIPFSLITIFLLIYTRGFLKTNQFTPVIDKLIIFLVLLKLIALAVGIWQSYPVLLHSLTDNMIILGSLIAGIARYRQGFKAARFFILSLCLVYFGMIIHSVLQILREETTYSFIQDGDFIFSFANMTVLEIILFTIAISDRYRTLKKEKEHSQNLLIVELDEKQKLTQEMNHILELNVKNRTHELALANVKIQQMNDLLLAYNQKLEGDVTVLEKDKIMRKSISIDEFKKIFSSEDICYQYLVELKWSKGYECKKCENTTASNGKMPYSHRCTKCGYEESPTTFTIFYKLKFSIVKAFYILFLVTERKDISAQKIAEMILLRRQTCDDFKRKVLDKIQTTKRPKEASEGWSYLILE